MSHIICIHPPSQVTADIMEGDYAQSGLRWCRLCGAYQRYSEDWEGEWRLPKPLTRAEFLKLPMDERRSILAAQAEVLIEHYQHNDFTSLT